MGTWGVGPFANDTAADFASYLDEAAADDRESMIRSALKRAADPAEQLEAPRPPREPWPRHPWSSHSTLTAKLRVRTTAPRNRCRAFPQTFECSPSMPWTKWSPSRLNSPS